MQAYHFLYWELILLFQSGPVLPFLQKQILPSHKRRIPV